jgi:serine protease
MSAVIRRAAVTRTAAVLLVCAALLPAAHAEEFNPYAARLAPAPTDRVIVKLRASERAQALSATQTQATPAADDRMATLGRRTSVGLRDSRAITNDLHVVRVDGIQSVGGLESAVERLRADASVEYAEPDRRMRRHLAPSDTLFQAQWYLQAAQSTANGSTASATNAVAAWDVTTGSNSVVVAVLDTGVRFDHPDLGRVGAGGKLLDGRDFVSTDSGGQALTANDGDGWDADPSDPGDWVSLSDVSSGRFPSSCLSQPDRDDPSSWHGTRVAGIVGARTNNALGVAGTGWNTRVLPVRVLGKCGGFTSDIIAGMRWAAGLPVQGPAANPTPAKVLNLSLGGDGECSVAYQSAVDEIVANGVMVVVSAGNDGSTVDAPANCRGVVAVGALRHVGNKVGFSNLGPGVTVSAPGGNCVNTGAGQPCLFSIDTTTNLGTTAPAGNDYTNQTRFNVGTSFSAPIVSGIAGLMYAVNGTLTPAQATARLRASARAFPVVVEADPVTNQPIPQCRVPTGATDFQTSQCNCTKRTCGAGMADAGAALAALARPLAAATASAIAPGQTVTLDAAISSAGTGASIASYAWSVRPGATGTPALSATTGPTTSLPLPGTGALAVQLVVTDTNGGTDTAVIPLLVTAPNVVAQSRTAAATALAAADLELGGVTTQVSGTVATGNVISQSVVAGASVAPGTAVAIVVSSGPPPPVAVPSVVGQTQAAATSALTGAGFVLGTVTTESSTTVPSGNVISQSPAAGTSVPSGTSVSLVVSSGSPGVGGPFGGGGGGGGGGGALDAQSLLAAGIFALFAGWARRRRHA